MAGPTNGQQAPAPAPAALPPRSFEEHLALGRQKQLVAEADAARMEAEARLKEAEIRFAEIQLEEARLPTLYEAQLEPAEARAVASSRARHAMAEQQLDLDERMFRRNIALAEMLAASPYIPNGISNEERVGFALGVIELAPMLGVSYWALAQSSYPVYGRISLEVDFLQAVVQGKCPELLWEVEVSTETTAVNGTPAPAWVEVRAQRDRISKKWPVRVARVTGELVRAASWSKEKDGSLKPAYRTEAARMMRRRAAARVLADNPEFKELTAGIPAYDEEDATPQGAAGAGASEGVTVVQQPAAPARTGLAGLADRYPAKDVEAEPVEPQKADGEGVAPAKPPKRTGKLFGDKDAQAPAPPAPVAPPNADQLAKLRMDLGEETWRHACQTHGVSPNAQMAQVSEDTRMMIAVDMERAVLPPDDWRWARTP